MIKKKAKKTANKKKTAKNKKGLITKDMIIGGVVQKHPEIMEVMFDYGLHCIGCHVSAYESIEQGCLAHGLSRKKIDEMVAKINKRIKK